MKNWKFIVVLGFSAIAHWGCAMLDYTPPEPPPAPARTDPPVSAIRNSNLVISVSLDASYDLNDMQNGRVNLKSETVNFLNELGKDDGNSFAEQNGNPVNFYYNFLVHNDGQDHYSGSLELRGWGQGHICTFNTKYDYADALKMFHDLLVQSYVFIHNGWRAPRDSNHAPSGS